MLSNSCSPDVNSTRIRPANLVLDGRRKSGDGSSTPSLLSHLYGEYRSQQLSQVQHQSESSVVELFPVVLNTSLLLSMLMGKNNSVNVVKSIKENNQTEGKGWLRKIEANLKNIELQQKEKTYLNEYEKELVLKLLLPLKPLYNRASSIIAYAWDVDPSTINRMIITAKKSTTFTIKRKKRCDAGNTLLNSNKKCESVITAKHVFKKIKQQQITGGEQHTRDEIFSAWTSLSNDRLCELNRTALEQKTRCQTLYLEIGQVLRRTRGAITWRQLTSQINGVGTPVIHWSSMRRHVMKLPQSSYTTTRLLPKLNSGTKKKRLDWAKAF